ncbi:hypothetical protein [Desulfovibrio psychrotolerans]|uniref:Uncharacterized protein n=1 Tax=Desulfovibrio psychrotolerans TaxID=415242 RepID=A0A7J0BUN2_9BACT|nr:hypothetical protein [Desulfovibrio psychrotolerans]GFM37417.1 hypothetical protein DSM19430T_21010 [Desulfovibrio psychrotolerans]
MNYTDSDFPVCIREAEMATLAGGMVVRYEESGGARDVFVDDEWSSRATLFPGMNLELESGGTRYLLSADDNGLRVERMA